MGEAFAREVTEAAITANSSTASVVFGLKTCIMMVVQGTWNTATVTLEGSPDGGTTWIEVAAGITADGFVRSEAKFHLFRATTSSVGGSTSLTVWLF